MGNGQALLLIFIPVGPIEVTPCDLPTPRKLGEGAGLFIELSYLLYLHVLRHGSQLEA